MSDSPNYVITSVDAAPQAAPKTEQVYTMPSDADRAEGYRLLREMAQATQQAKLGTLTATDRGIPSRVQVAEATAPKPDAAAIPADTGRKVVKTERITPPVMNARAEAPVSKTAARPDSFAAVAAVLPEAKAPVAKAKEQKPQKVAQAKSKRLHLAARATHHGKPTRHAVQVAHLPKVLITKAPKAMVMASGPTRAEYCMGSSLQAWETAECRAQGYTTSGNLSFTAKVLASLFGLDKAEPAPTQMAGKATAHHPRSFV